MTERFRLPASLVLGLGSFPLWYWLSRWQYRGDGTAFALLGAALLLCTAAWLHKRLDAPLCRRSLLLAGLLTRGIAVGIGVGTYFAASQVFLRAGAVTAGILLGFLYLLFWQIQRLPVGALLSVYAFILLGVAYFISQVICHLQSSRSLGGICLWMLAGTAMLFVILRSLYMLTEISEHRDKPNGFYRHNLLLITGFLLPGAVLFLLGKPILAGVRAFLHWFWNGLVMLVRWMAVLIVGEDLFAEPLDLTGEAPPDPTLGMRLAGIITLVTLGAGLFLVIRFRRELWDFLTQIVVDGLRTLQRLARRRAPAVTEEIHTEYTDRSELLEAAAVSGKRPARGNSLRSGIRAYRRERDPRKRFRMGYALWMRALQGWQAELRAQDTPAQILERASGIPEPALTGEITEIYYRVRYGGHVPDAAELSQMDALVKLLR